MAWLLRWMVFVALVCLSLAAPIGIVVWSWHSNFGDKSSEVFATAYRIYNHTAIHGHELWYYSVPLKDEADSNGLESPIRRLNLETGEDVATAIRVPGIDCQLIWRSDSLYIFSNLFSSDKSLYRWDGASLHEIAKVPGTHHLRSTDPFVFAGQVTVISEFQPERYRLQHLIQDRWEDGKEIVIPTQEQFVALYSEAGQAFIQMYLNNGQRSLSFRFKSRTLSEQPRLVLADVASTYKVCRDGFQFVDPPDDVASAISPDNAPTLLWNWHAFDPDEHQVFVTDSMQIPDGEILQLEDGRLMRRQYGEEMQEIPLTVEPFGPESFATPHLLTSEDGKTKYILTEDGTNLQRVNVHRIEGARILPAHVRLPGVVDEYLNRWKRLLAGIFAAWAAHTLILIASLEWILRRRVTSPADQDLPSISFASVSRRSLALLVDTVVVLVVPILIFSRGIAWPETTSEILCDVLRGIEWSATELFNEVATDWDSLWQNLDMTWATTIDDASSFCEVMLPKLTESPLSFIAIAVSLCLLLFLRCRFEGQFGVTPGKWLLGIRTVRTDQRPSRFARSLLRTVLVSIDLFFFITPLPALISLLFSQKNQRLGDRLADTVVVRQTPRLMQVTSPAVGP